MAEDTEARGAGAGGAFVRFIDWLEEKLMGVLGPPPVGPYDAIVEQVGKATCPVCGEPMSAHTIDHSMPNAVLHCPAPPLLPGPDDTPLNELGMEKHTD